MFFFPNTLSAIVSFLDYYLIIYADTTTTRSLDNVEFRSLSPRVRLIVRKIVPTKSRITRNYRFGPARRCPYRAFRVTTRRRCSGQERGYRGTAYAVYPSNARNGTHSSQSTRGPCNPTWRSRRICGIRSRTGRGISVCWLRVIKGRFTRRGVARA